MKMWVKKPEQFNNVFCVLPLSIHMQHRQEAKLYVPHAIGRVKSEVNYNDIVIEVSLYLYFNQNLLAFT